MKDQHRRNEGQNSNKDYIEHPEFDTNVFFEFRDKFSGGFVYDPSKSLFVRDVHNGDALHGAPDGQRW